MKHFFLIDPYVEKAPKNILPKKKIQNYIASENCDIFGLQKAQPTK